MSKKISVGGQALIEGIMMKGPEKTTMAVRMPDGQIDLTEMNSTSIKDKIKPLKLPFLRGIVNFIEAMIQGYKALMLSADKSGFTEVEEEDENGEKKVTKLSKVAMGVVTVLAAVLGVGLAVVLFMLLPRLAVDGITYLAGRPLPVWARSLIEQVIKMSVFVFYVWIVSYMKDIKRVFMYHGAEHKTIFCFEAGLPLTVENVRKQKRFHPRCGTSFMILMILVGFIFSTVIQLVFEDVYANRWFWVLVKIAMVPFICGVGYELLKICGRYDNFLTRIIAAPGLWLQRITTKEPEDGMIEIAIAAVNDVLPEEEKIPLPSEDAE
ncbi:MAG: DUF1385 domain-containing protein [Clostridia bacterium]|nr:DUF1385 domain-containing protein [Clostridia bacterium]